MYRYTKLVDWCQCCQQGVALTAAQGSSDFFGDDDAAEIIDPSNNACSFHIYSLLVMLSNYDASICKDRRIIRVAGSDDSTAHNTEVR